MITSKKLKNTPLVLACSFGLYFLNSCNQAEPTPSLPNILLILADDLGYGDLACYNSASRIPTPRLDQLAREGMRFTDAHSPSTVCTPTRYSVLTGRMAFRTGMRSVFVGVQGPCLIEPGRLTLPQMLSDAGYATACFGKWHIGMSFFDSDSNLITDGSVTAVDRVDYSRRIPDGPTAHGFDHFFGTVSCPTTDWIYAYVENDRIPHPPTHKIDKAKLPTHAYSVDCRAGLIADNFDLERVDLVFLEKSKSFLKNHVRTSPHKPFFLYHAMQAVHLPSFPAPEFKGKTNSGPHGDFIFQMDYIVGVLLDELDALGVADNTLVIFASDNGPEVITVKDMRKNHQHDGASPWRGVKRDQWEGGHRTPLLIRWPGKVKPNTVSDQLISLTDIMPTCAAIIGKDLDRDVAEDGFNMLQTWVDPDLKPAIRPHLLQQTITLDMSIRNGPWKYLDHRGSGGNNYEKEGAWSMKEYAIDESDPSAPGQLYNLDSDPGEINNLYTKYPQKVYELKSQLEYFKTLGRSNVPYVPN